MNCIIRSVFTSDLGEGVYLHKRKSGDRANGWQIVYFPDNATTLELDEAVDALNHFTFPADWVIVEKSSGKPVFLGAMLK